MTFIADIRSTNRSALKILPAVRTSGFVPWKARGGLSKYPIVLVVQCCTGFFSVLNFFPPLFDTFLCVRIYYINWYKKSVFDFILYSQFQNGLVFHCILVDSQYTLIYKFILIAHLLFSINQLTSIFQSFFAIFIHDHQIMKTFKGSEFMLQSILS